MILATAAEVFTYIGYVLAALLCLMLMIVIHEFGHFLAGKLLGFKIEEFGIGFGPKIFKKRFKSGMLFSIRPLPLGGFCQFEGEDEEGNESPTAFNNQKPWKRIIVLVSGALFNFVSGIIIISIFFMAYGQVLPKIVDVYETAPSATIDNLKEGDVILGINGKQVNILLQNDFSELLAKQDGEVTFRVMHVDGTVEDFVLVRGDYSYVNDDGETVETTGFGFSMGFAAVKLSFGRAIGRSFGFAFYIVYSVLAILGKLITGQLGMSAVGGTVTTIKAMADSASAGFSSLLYLVCIISANLAVMNLLPLPALDGGRIVFVLIEWIFRRPVPRKVEAIIHTVGLLLLFGFAIFADVFQFLII